MSVPCRKKLDRVFIIIGMIEEDTIFNGIIRIERPAVRSRLVTGGSVLSYHLFKFTFPLVSFSVVVFICCFLQV